MKTKLTILTIAALLPVAALQAQTQPLAARADQQITAECRAAIELIHTDAVRWEPYNEEAMDAFCEGAARQALADRQDLRGRVRVTPRPHEQFPPVTLRARALSSHAGRLRTQVDLTLFKGGQDEAEQVLREAGQRIERSLKQQAENYKETFRSAVEAAGLRLARAEERLAEAARRRAEGYRLKDGLLIMGGGMLATQVNDLQSQGPKTLLLLEGKKARLDAVQRQIAIIADEAAKEAEEDPVAKELREILSLQERALVTVAVQAKGGIVSQAEVDQQKINIARARAELAQRIEDSREEFQGGVLARLNEELATLAIDVAELEAKLKLTKSLLGELQKAQLRFSLREKTRFELDFAEEAYRNACRQREKLLDQARDVPEPKVTVWVLDKPAGTDTPGTWRKLTKPDTQPAQRARK